MQPKPLSVTMGPELYALYEELHWAIMKSLYHAAERQREGKSESEFVNFYSNEYQNKLSTIYVKHPNVPNKTQVFEGVLSAAEHCGLIKSVDTQFTTQKTRLYAITKLGAPITEPWYRANGGVHLS